MAMKMKVVVVKCQEEPDLFFSDKISDKLLAKDICSSCPFKSSCFASAVEAKERFGIWGGEDFSEMNLPRKRYEDPNKATGYCRKGIHPKEAPGKCKPCAKEQDKVYAKRYYQKLKDEGRLQEVLGAARERRKHKIGGLCNNKKHLLTTENTMIREYDGALMCGDCYRRVRPVVLSQEVRKKARGYN